ncbi:MAG: RagB/SusD family nutrient uptake outer membrane protein [Candidatus Pseudobacter hemicellulosilyticus]|uniref:RagB/SusD family nutrient uptake outer membrane protein n=1 Tax=Candidatus Pseudobacter hemicellulosilyticus TaxID=3121375 RepID=A0AAJ5WV05_9BACT|nr:MAG: RagB/SusD family nutrient uptake outer membrane protein [Pseudobacter sp.]
MRTYQYCIYIFTLLVMTLYSCNKEWLEVKADAQQAVPTTNKDFQALLDQSVRMNNFLISLGEVAADGHYVDESAWNSADAIAKNAYTWSHDLPYRDVVSWLGIYNRIFNNNIVLDGMTKRIDPVSEDDKFVLGQALFNRSVAFWSVAQHYCNPFNNNTASSELGIPLRLNIDLAEQSKRSTVMQTYGQILSDLKTSATYLPKDTPYPTRPDKAAAFAMLARTYLSMSIYDSAYVYSNRSLELENDLIDFTELSESQPNFGLFPKEVLFHDVLYTGEVSGFLTRNYLVDSTFYDSYDENDLRKIILFSKNNNLVTFKGNYNDNADELFAGLAVDEMYLVRAECLVRLGKIDEGLNDLNYLLKKRYKKSVDGTSLFEDYTAVGETEALQYVLQERRKELILRGLRWSDLRRLNSDERFDVTIDRIVDDELITLLPGSKRYTFPIPDDVIEQSGMTQNMMFLPPTKVRVINIEK